MTRSACARRRKGADARLVAWQSRQRRKLSGDAIVKVCASGRVGDGYEEGERHSAWAAVEKPAATRQVAELDSRQFRLVGSQPKAVVTEGLPLSGIVECVLARAGRRAECLRHGLLAHIPSVAEQRERMPALV